MNTITKLTVDVLIMLWWIGLWNSVDIIINRYVDSGYYLTTNLIIGITSFYLYYICQ